MRFRNFLFLLTLLLLFLPTLKAQERGRVLPRVIDYAPPIYPQIAKTAHISGPVHLRITTDGHAVTSVDVVDGPALLVRAATNNVKTWKFVDHTPGTFDVTLDFTTLKDKTTFLAEPGVVDIAVLPPDYGGNASKRLDYTLPAAWDLELKTPADDIKAPLTLWTYGPWLRGYTLGRRSQERDLDEPRVDGDMFGFEVLLDDSFGQRLAFSLVGKKSGDKIQGIFLDPWGRSGTWTATPSKPAAPNCPAPSAAAEENIIPVPEITQGRKPRYPPLPWEAGIQGQVRMRVTADSYCVAKITAESSEALLAQAAEANVRTWWFGYHKPGTFNLTFNYRFLQPTVSFLEKPGVVEISATPSSLPFGPGLESGLWNVGGYEDEVWRARLDSPRGRIQATFHFGYGCCDEGHATYAKGKSEKITQGFRSSDDVGFSTIITMANGRRARGFFIGNLRNDDRIQGVFLDESGERGTWSARLVSHGRMNEYM
jgi:hypothetical protein